MYYEYYLLSIFAVLLCGILCAVASAKVHGAYKKYGAIPCSSRMTGRDVAERLLSSNGARDINIGKVRGTLSDHYHPTKKIVNLSESVYGNNSVAAVAVAAHEVGHVMQKKKGYFPYKLRTWLVPITNIGTMLAVPLMLVGVLLDFFLAATENSSVGFILAMVGVGLYGLSTLFALVTLPVELNASRRAKQMLVAEGVLTERELPYADKMLSAAAMTYVASLLTSLIYFLRMLLWVAVMLNNNRRRD